MKKISLILILLLTIGFVASAQDEAELPTAEEVQAALADLAALKAQTPIAVTGSITFGLGADTQPDTPDLPVYSIAKAATAAVTVSSSDDLVSASIGLNLLADPSLSGAVDFDWLHDNQYDVTSTLSTYQAQYLTWEMIQDYVTFFNDAFDDVDTEDVVIFEDLDLDGLVTTLNANVTIGNIAEENADANGIDLDAAVAPSATPGDDEFAFTTARAAQMGPLVAAVEAAVDTLVDEAIEEILDDADDIDINTITTVAGLTAYIGSLTVLEIEDLSATDITVVTAAVDYNSAYIEAITGSLYGDIPVDQIGVTNTLALTGSGFITSASFTLKKIAGILDMSGDLVGGHVAVGNINLDQSGHIEDAVSAYPSARMGLSAGIVEGLTAGITIYSDDNGAANEVDAVADTWYSWIDETVAQADPVEPKLGLKVDAGYTMALGEGISAGLNAALGLYDLLSTEDPSASQLGFTVAPFFKGAFGDLSTAANVQFDYGLGMMYIGIDASMTIMGITPSVRFKNVGLDADDAYDLAFLADGIYASGEAAVKGLGGMVVGCGVAVDLGTLIGITGSVSGGADFAIPTTGDSFLNWNAAVSVTPIDFLTVSGGIGDVGIWRGALQDGGLLGWNGGVSLAISKLAPEIPITVAGNINSAYKADPDNVAVSKLGWNGSIALAHGIATVTAKVESGWDSADDEDYIKYGLTTTLSF